LLNESSFYSASDSGIIFYKVFEFAVFVKEYLAVVAPGW